MRQIFVISMVTLLAMTTAMSGPQAKGQRQTDGLEGETLSMRSEIKVTDALKQAALIQPVALHRLKESVPERIGKFTRSKLDGTRSQAGPAALTQADAQFVDDQQRLLQLSLIDPGGIPPLGKSFLPQLEAGVRESFSRGYHEGVSIEGFPATLEKLDAGQSQTLQIMAGPRLRVTLTGYGVEAAELVELAGTLDLAALAALAPETPPEIDLGAKQ
ncbi:MAG: hypothetical protein JSV80_13230 [Acidobacteriota bacterium]|nr:MAG: hypothetical protein JSV80_13230 [Acidobacteriota bacterium]